MSASLRDLASATLARLEGQRRFVAPVAPLHSPGNATNATTQQRASEAGSWSASDWRRYFDERAGIAEHDGGLSRPLAEGAAWEATIAEWCRLNPPAHVPGHCAACNGALDMAGQGWRPVADGATVHYASGLACWKDYGAKRRSAAIEALQGFGIEPPGDKNKDAA